MTGNVCSPQDDEPLSLSEAWELMREKVAALEHEQWAHWTAYMLDNLTPENIERWRRQIKTPYSELSEKEKESDREWANKGIKIYSSFACEV
jgi:hypothetical protein